MAPWVRMWVRSEDRGGKIKWPERMRLQTITVCFFFLACRVDELKE